MRLSLHWCEISESGMLLKVTFLPVHCLFPPLELNSRWLLAGQLFDSTLAKSQKGFALRKPSLPDWTWRNQTCLKSCSSAETGVTEPIVLGEKSWSKREAEKRMPANDKEEKREIQEISSLPWWADLWHIGLKPRTAARVAGFSRRY